MWAFLLGVTVSVVTTIVVLQILSRKWITKTVWDASGVVHFHADREAIVVRRISWGEYAALRDKFVGAWPGTKISLYEADPRAFLGWLDNGQ